ncbi:ATP-binding protein [Desulfogranum marinum]|uniref:ATP-binding protein n=1 Tax=Desulfogranum marinum TaxID=453220 RepID=UPI0029C7532D|nr:ATP-binding protein [Desulfogranum marinum]
MQTTREKKISRELFREIGILAGRFAEFLRQKFVDGEKALEGALHFLDHAFASVSEGTSLAHWQGSLLDRINPVDHHPLHLLIGGFGFSPCEVDLLLLAGMADEHEGFADIFRTLHPQGQPRPTVGLATQFFCQGPEDRNALRKTLTTGPAVKAGVLHLDGDDEPFFNRNIRTAEMIWPVLHGIDAWPSEIEKVDGKISRHGLDDWLQEATTGKAMAALRSASNCTVLINGDDDEGAFQRGSALTVEAGVDFIRIRLATPMSPYLDRIIGVHAMARGAVPVLRIPHGEGPNQAVLPQFDHFPGPVVLCSRGGVGKISRNRPLITVNCRRLTPTALRDMWKKTIPALAADAEILAARFPVEPWHALQVADDLQSAQQYNGFQVHLNDVSSIIRGRAATNLEGGVSLIRPEATWEHLVLPTQQLKQLHEALNRLYMQGKVLDDWRFLEGRRGARGVRMLFTGPPGTGKTLSAEILASSLDVDLLQVDLSRVVSKWIGETEKNLAQVFETAERAKAVLLFDEADALFGKRTEVSDAHDRYANLETAYLLSRLERFEGMAILSTNLRQNIDTAFTRRLEFIVDFVEPSREQRLALWKCHLPERAPLAPDVELEEIAKRFAIVGGLIRNAAVAAAFLAAADNSAISKEHFINAIRREYEKSGKPFREVVTRNGKCEV